jgi:hypothetical protein
MLQRLVLLSIDTQDLAVGVGLGGPFWVLQPGTTQTMPKSAAGACSSI